MPGGLFKHGTVIPFPRKIGLHMSAILVVSGIVCLSLSGLMMYKLTPREGRPPSPWTSTEFRAMSVALSVLVLLLGGVALLVKGIF